MDDPPGLVMRWGWYAVWAAGGVGLLARYRRHPRASRRGLAGVAVALGLLAPLHAGVGDLLAAAGQPRWGLPVFRAVNAVLHTLSVLLLAWAAAADRPRPASDDV